MDARSALSETGSEGIGRRSIKNRIQQRVEPLSGGDGQPWPDGVQYESTNPSYTKITCQSGAVSPPFAHFHTVVQSP